MRNAPARASGAEEKESGAGARYENELPDLLCVGLLAAEYPGPDELRAQRLPVVYNAGVAVGPARRKAWLRRRTSWAEERRWPSLAISFSGLAPGA